MKTRIFGALFVLAILFVLFVLTGGVASTTVVQPTQSQQQNSSDADFKNLNIN